MQYRICVIFAKWEPMWTTWSSRPRWDFPDHRLKFTKIFLKIFPKISHRSPKNYYLKLSKACPKLAPKSCPKTFPKTFPKTRPKTCLKTFAKNHESLQNENWCGQLGLPDLGKVSLVTEIKFAKIFRKIFPKITQRLPQNYYLK